MLLINKIAGFINKLYLKKKLMNQLNLWHDDKDFRNKVWFVNFWLGVIERALIQSYFRILRSAISSEQLDQSACFLHAEID